MSAAAAATAWHRDQRARVAGFKPSRPEMPGEHRCAPSCTEPPPPLPPGISEDFWVATPQDGIATWIVVSALVVVAGLLTARALRPK